MRRKIKLLRHYRGAEGEKIYICTCGVTIPAWSLPEAKKKHKHNQGSK